MSNYPSSVRHCNSCAMGELEPGDNLHQAVEAGEAALYTEILRRSSRNDVDEIVFAARMPDAMLQRHIAAQRCARTILDGNCFFYTARVDREGKTTIFPQIRSVG